MRVTKAFYINCHDFFFFIVGAKWVGISYFKKKMNAFLYLFSVLFFVSWSLVRMERELYFYFPLYHFYREVECGYLFWWTSGTHSTRILVLIYVFPFRLI